MNTLPYRKSQEESLDMEAECRYHFVNANPGLSSLHCHDYYEIFLTVSGSVTHLVNQAVVKVPENTLVFVRPDDVHGFRYQSSTDTDTTFINLAFSRNTLELLFTYLSDHFPSKELLLCPMPPSVILSHAEKKLLLSQISALDLVNWQDKQALKFHMRVLLADIFAHYFYSSVVSRQTHPETPLWFQQLIRLMEQPEHFCAGLERMIALSGKTQEHLSRCSKKYLGITATEYINDLRINYASNLLLNTNTPILDICYACGFQSVSRFYQAFKKNIPNPPVISERLIRLHQSRNFSIAFSNNICYNESASTNKFYGTR